MSADFTPIIPDPPAQPSKGSYTDLKPFRFWCQKVLPLVYDESLSYYEVVCKVVDYLNKTMEDVGVLHDDVDSMFESFQELTNWTDQQIDTVVTAYGELQSYVNNYFENLDVQQEINNKLDAMAAAGTLTNLISPFVPDAVASWLAAHVDPATGYVVDNTLSISGAAADAKATGDRIDYLSHSFNEFSFEDIQSNDLESGSWSTTGAKQESTKWIRTKAFCPVNKETILDITPGTVTNKLFYRLFDTYGTLISSSEVITAPTKVTIANDCFIVFVFGKISEADISVSDYDCVVIKENLFDIFRVSNTLQVKLSDFAFEAGTINNSGEPLEVYWAKRSDYISALDDQIFNITIESGYKARVAVYDSTKTFSRLVDWTQNELLVYLSAGEYFRVVIGSVSETTLENNDDVLDKCYILSNSSMTDDIKILNSYLYNKLPSSFYETGAINAQGEDVVNANTRRTTFIEIDNTHPIRIYDIPLGYRVYWFTYDENKDLVNRAMKWCVTNAIVNATGAKYLRLAIYAWSGNVSGTDYLNIKLAKGKFDSEYETNTILAGLFYPQNSKRYIYGKGKMWEYLWNTEEAYQAAGESPYCWGMTGDIQYTSDGEIVMYHDITVTYEDENVAISSLTLEEVQSIVLTDESENTYTIPTLSTFLHICRTYGKVPILETKSYTPGENWTQAGHTDELIYAISQACDYGFERQLMIIAQANDVLWLSSNYPNIGKIAIFDGGGGSLFEERVKPHFPDPQYMYAGYPKTSYYYMAFSAANIAEIHKNNRFVIGYLPRPQVTADVETMIAANFDAVICYAAPPEEA